MQSEHWMNFSTFAEQRFFVYPSPNSYDSVLFNANMVAHAPDGIAAFLVEKTAGAHYVVDPQTHAFQHSPIHIKNTKGELKSSIRRLAESYGPLILSIAGNRPIQASDFEQTNKVNSFVSSVISFQKGVARLIQDNPINKKYLGGHVEDQYPRFVVAPYFYLEESSYKSWLPLNVRCAEISKNFTADCPLWIQVVISQGVLTNPEIRQDIVSALVQLDGVVSGVLLWIDDFEEQAASIIALEGYVDLLRAIKDRLRLPVVNLRGSFFSECLTSEGLGGLLAGVSHGPEYGENRAVVPVGGGIPTAKYYIPSLFKRFKYREAVDTFETLGYLSDANAFHENVCDCDECVRTINGDVGNFVLFGASNIKEVKRGKGFVRMGFPVRETKERCLRHYLERKCEEHGFVRAATKAEMLNKLEEGVEKYANAIGAEGIAHLMKWKGVLSDLV